MKKANRKVRRASAVKWLVVGLIIILGLSIGLTLVRNGVSIPKASLAPETYLSCNKTLTWGIFGSEDYQLNAPTQIYADTNTDSLFVVDSGNNKVKQFETKEGEFVRVFGKEEVKNPKDVTLVETGMPVQSTLYVLDNVEPKMKMYRVSDGRYLGSWPKNVINIPVAVFYNKLNRLLYVLDQNEDGVERIKVFTQGGYLEREFVVEVSAPYDIEVDVLGNIYVMDKDLIVSRVNIYNSNGVFVRSIGGGQYLEYPQSFALANFNSFANLLATSYGTHDVRQFQVSTGMYLTKGNIGMGDLLSPSGIAVNLVPSKEKAQPLWNVFVSNSWEANINKFICTKVTN